jgi:hypothetical protein
MKAFGGMSQADYDTSTKVYERGMGGDTEALKIYEQGDIGKMKAFLSENPDLSLRVSEPAPGGTTAPGAVPTAAELLKQQSSSPFPGVPPATDAEIANLMQRYQQPPSAAILGTTELPGVSPQQAALNANNLGTGIELPLLNSNTPPPFSSSFSSPGQQAALDANNLGMLPGTQPTRFFDKMVTGAKGMYDEYLSPDRAGLPADAGIFQKYGPLAAAGTAARAAFGGMDSSPADKDPAFNRNYTGSDYMRDNPDRFSGRLYNYQSQGAGSYDPYRNTYYSGAQGANASGVVTPTGIMQAEYSPYYGRRAQRRQQYYSPFIGTSEPVMAAKGGSIREFPRKNGPINGPGTGTSDDIPAMLSDGEFVFTAKAVRNAGAGSRRKGAARMYKLMKSIEKGGKEQKGEGVRKIRDTRKMLFLEQKQNIRNWYYAMEGSRKMYGTWKN